MHGASTEVGNDVFVSYASQDAAVATSIVEALERKGIRCWIAPRDVVPGSLYAEGIVRAINGAKVFALVLSRHSVASSHVGKEIERASSKHKPIIAVHTDEAPLAPAFEYFLSESQWIELAPDGADAAAAKLAEAVRRHLDPSVALQSRATPDGPSAHHTAAAPGAKWILATGVAVLSLALAYFVVDKFGLSKHTVEEHPAAATGSATPVAFSGAVAISDKSVAVLPFVDMSEKKDQEYFSDGMSEELIDMLTKVPGLRVPARTSSFYFKGKQATIGDIAKALSVSHVLEGSVRKSGKIVRITVQLVRVDTGYHLWSETYDRQLNDIFKIQDDIAIAVVTALRASLVDKTKPQTSFADNLRAVPKTREDLRPQNVLTKNADAYTRYLQARSSFQRGTKDDPETARVDYETALDHLHDALKLDPAFAAAWAEVAKVRVRQAMAHLIPVRQATEDARRSAERALALDSQLPAAYLAVGSVHYVFDWNWPAAEAEFKRAIELDPGNADAFRWAAYVATTLGHFDEALDLARMAVDLDPLEVLNYKTIGRLYFRTSRYAEAATAWRTGRALNPAYLEDDPAALTLLVRGEAAAALAEYARLPWKRSDSWFQAMAYHALGRREESDLALARFVNLQSDETAVDVAEIYAYRGEIADALSWLDRAYERHDDGLRTVKGDPFLRNLEHDPRYKVFLRKLKLPE